MRFRVQTYGHILLLLTALLCGSLQAFGKTKQNRVIIILDGSASILSAWSTGITKYDAAATFISKLQDSLYGINEDVQFCLRLYGHMNPASMQNCRDSRLEVYFSKDNRSQIRTRLAALQPGGIASLGYALQQSTAYDILDSTDYYTVVLITSGERYCEGNICSLAEGLRNKISGKSYIVNLSTSQTMTEGYSCIGKIFHIPDTNAMQAAIDTISMPFRKSTVKTDTVYAYSEPLVQRDTISFQMGSYLLLTSNYSAASIQLHAMTPDGYKPINKTFSLPMRKKESMTNGRYRVYYIITGPDKKQYNRVKEFYIRKDMDNTVELD